MPGTFTQLTCHIVFSTKNRRPWIDPSWQDRLYAYIGGTAKKLNSTLLIAGGTSDHVHLLIRHPPTASISDLVRAIKANSSKWVNDEIATILKFGWQEGYGAFSVSRSQVEMVTRYIRNQERHHAKTDFKTEFRSLLDKHEIEYEERYLWD